jgi:hypothetical protein
LYYAWENHRKTEAGFQYDNEKMISKIMKQAEHIKSENDASQAGYFLRENRVLKPYVIVEQ